MTKKKFQTNGKTNEEKILERLDRIETMLTPIADSAASVTELKEELTPRVNEAVQALIINLADVEADFQLEKLVHLIKKLMRNIDNFGVALDLLNMMVDFSVNAEPLMKVSVPKFISTLDELEQKNVFRMLYTGLEVLKNITEAYTPEDIEKIAGKFGKIKEADTAGPLTLIRAMNDPEIQNGLGVVLELTRVLAAVKGKS